MTALDKLLLLSKMSSKQEEKTDIMLKSNYTIALGTYLNQYMMLNT